MFSFLYYFYKWFIKIFHGSPLIILKEKVIYYFIVKKATYYTFKKQIPTDRIIKWISIDPQLKILKEIKSITVVNQDEKYNLIDLLNNQLESDLTTIAEKISSLHLLKNCYSKKTVELLKNVILTAHFYGVAGRSS